MKKPHTAGKFLIVAAITAGCASSSRQSTRSEGFEEENLVAYDSVEEPDEPALESMANNDELPMWDELPVFLTYPTDPIDGERITLQLPHPASQDTVGDCITLQPHVRISEETWGFRLFVRLTVRGDCSQSGPYSFVRLDPLEAGQYLVESGSLQGQFVVRPAGTDPGDLPLNDRLRIEVARSYPTNECDCLPERPQDEFQELRISRQMAHAFPDVSVYILERWFEAGQGVSLDDNGDDRWTYTYQDYTDGRNECIRATMVGDVWLEQGDIVVSEPGAIDSERIECEQTHPPGLPEPD